MQVPKLQYTGGTSLLHRLMPLTKVVTFTLLIVAVFLIGHWLCTCSVAVLLVVLHLGSGLGHGRLVRLLRPLPIFILLIVLAHILLVRESGSILGDTLRGLHQSLKVVDTVVAVGVFLAVTDPLDLSDSLLRLLYPLRRIGLKVGELSLVVMIVFSFLPLVAEEAERLRNAQLVRCGFRWKGIAGARDVVPLVAPLVIGILRRSEEMELSLIARCYTPGRSRATSVRLRWGLADTAVCAASVIAFVIALYAKR
ncbi:MAG: energy-coupling factor transporter transmembrane protein EcfT [bacterium]|nr:MAG: energy-coupling factor transporter transmembrane protein EcfT [bacterium]